jgi:transposase-like protein
MANRNKNKASGEYYPGYRHPKVLIGYVVWSYHRFTLSLRDVSEQLLMRGIAVSYQLEVGLFYRVNLSESQSGIGVR